MSSVIIKSYNKGLAIHLDPVANIEVIKQDLAKSFNDAASFFGESTVAITFEDRDLDSTTERELANIITSNSKVHISCIAGKNQMTQALLKNALNQLEFKNEANQNNVQIYKGSLKDGRVIDVPGSVLILGDVYPGCSVIASGDIYVYGELYGQAYAGNRGDNGNIIAALDLKPEKLRIGGIKYKPVEKPKWTIKNKTAPIPQVAYIEDDVIALAPIDKQFWNKKFDDKKSLI